MNVGNRRGAEPLNKSTCISVIISTDLFGENFGSKFRASAFGVTIQLVEYVYYH